MLRHAMVHGSAAHTTLYALTRSSTAADRASLKRFCAPRVSEASGGRRGLVPAAVSVVVAGRGGVLVA